jgi:hypothetical protein
MPMRVSAPREATHGRRGSELEDADRVEDQVGLTRCVLEAAGVQRDRRGMDVIDGPRLRIQVAGLDSDLFGGRPVPCWSVNPNTSSPFRGETEFWWRGPAGQWAVSTAAAVGAEPVSAVVSTYLTSSTRSANFQPAGVRR